MSLHRRTNATLSGYIGPIFPLSIDRLAIQYNRRPLDRRWIERAAANIDGFADTHREVTSDGYIWLCSVRFCRNASSITILLPRSLDLEESGGVRNDRSPAAYIWGATEEMAETVVIELIEALAVQYDRDEMEAGSDHTVLAYN